MSAYCICHECLVRDIRTGRTPSCFEDVERDSDPLATLTTYLQAVGPENYSPQKYVAHRREQMGLPANPRAEWLHHLERVKAGGTLSPRQVDTLDELLERLREEGLA